MNSLRVLILLIVIMPACFSSVPNDADLWFANLQKKYIDIAPSDVEKDFVRTEFKKPIYKAAKNYLPSEILEKLVTQINSDKNCPAGIFIFDNIYYRDALIIFEAYLSLKPVTTFWTSFLCGPKDTPRDDLLFKIKDDYGRCNVRNSAAFGYRFWEREDVVHSIFSLKFCYPTSGLQPDERSNVSELLEKIRVFNQNIDFHASLITPRSSNFEGRLFIIQAAVGFTEKHMKLVMNEKFKSLLTSRISAYEMITILYSLAIKEQGEIDCILDVVLQIKKGRPKSDNECFVRTELLRQLKLPKWFAFEVKIFLGMTEDDCSSDSEWIPIVNAYHLGYLYGYYSASYDYNVESHALLKADTYYQNGYAHGLNDYSKGMQFNSISSNDADDAGDRDAGNSAEDGTNVADDVDAANDTGDLNDLKS